MRISSFSSFIVLDKNIPTSLCKFVVNLSSAFRLKNFLKLDRQIYYRTDK